MDSNKEAPEPFDWTMIRDVLDAVVRNGVPGGSDRTRLAPEEGQNAIDSGVPEQIQDLLRSWGLPVGAHPRDHKHGHNGPNHHGSRRHEGKHRHGPPRHGSGPPHPPPPGHAGPPPPPPGPPGHEGPPFPPASPDDHRRHPHPRHDHGPPPPPGPRGPPAPPAEGPSGPHSRPVTPPTPPTPAEELPEFPGFSDGLPHLGPDHHPRHDRHHGGPSRGKFPEEHHREHRQGPRHSRGRFGGPRGRRGNVMNDRGLARDPYGGFGGANPWLEQFLPAYDASWLNNLVPHDPKYPDLEADVPGTFTPDVDVFDKTDKIVIYASLPGAKKTDVHVNYNPAAHSVAISGHVARPDDVDEEMMWSAREAGRRVGYFTKAVMLPGAFVESERMKARLEDGVLRVEIPKPGEEDWEELKKVPVL